MRRAFLILFVVASASVVACAAVLRVSKDGSAPYFEVQPAISAASDGDSITVAPSFNTYAGFTVDRHVQIIGAGCDTLPGLSSNISDVVTITDDADSASLGSLWIVKDVVNPSWEQSATLRIQHGAHNIRISRCTVENTSVAGSYYSCCLFVDQNTDVVLIGCAMKVYSVNNHPCIRFADNGAPGTLTVTNTILLRGSIYGGATGSTITVRHCLINNEGGGVVYSPKAGGTIENTLYEVTVINGEFFYGSPGIMASYCATSGIIPASPGNIGAMSTDLVHYVDWDANHSDYHLVAGSNLRDAGDPITPPDRDGSRADIGIYGGQTPYAYFGLPDIPYVISLEVPVSVPQNGVLHIGSRGRIGPGS